MNNQELKTITKGSNILNLFTGDKGIFVKTYLQDGREMMEILISTTGNGWITSRLYKNVFLERWSFKMKKLTKKLINSVEHIGLGISSDEYGSDVGIDITKEQALRILKIVPKSKINYLFHERNDTLYIDIKK